MSAATSDGRRLTELQPARRNRYFYGKLMDVLHLSMEQDHGIGRQQAFDRLVIGPGVICGLQVTVIVGDGEPGLRIGAGLAVDGWGRRIVVPDDVDLVPVALTDDCGTPREDAGALPARLEVALCFRECLTDFGPVLVPDTSCDGEERCEAGTVVETYAIRVSKGTADAVAIGCADPVLAELRRADLHGALLAAAAPQCGSPPEDPCVVLANVSVAADGSLDVPSYAPRRVAPTNQVLLRLIACLAARIEECCSTHPTEPPTARLRVSRVGILLGAGGLASLATPEEKLTVAAAAEPKGFQVAFSGATTDQATVTPQSVVMQRGGVPVPGTISFRSPNVMAFTTDTLPTGDYEVRLFGTTPAIMSKPTASQPAVALDGDIPPQIPPNDPPGFPTGDGVAGGDYAFTFTVA